MAGLTRTQKYAQLRSELNNDSEPQVTTNDLNGYRDKLKGFEDSFNKELDDTFAKIEEKSRLDEVPSYQDLNAQFKSQQGNEQFIDFLTALDTKNLEKDINNAITAKTEPPVTEAPVQVTRPQPQPAPQPVQVLQPETPVIVTAPVQPSPVMTQPVSNTVTSDIGNQFKDVMNELDSITAPQPQPQPQYQPTYQQPYQPQYQPQPQPAPQPAPAPQPVRVAPVPVVNDEYLNDTLKEVTDYNRNEGNRTIDQIPNEIVDTVRHPETLNREDNDDEFSSTVTLEIDKVLNEVKPDDAAREEVKAEPAKEAEETFEHPVLTKELEEEFGISFAQTSLQPPIVENIKIRQRKASGRTEQRMVLKTMSL